MKRLILTTLIIVSIITFAGNAQAWIPGGELVTIDEVITWQDDNPWVVMKLSSGYYCYFDSSQINKALLTVVVSAHVAQKTVSVHCFDTEENKGGYMSHRLHRIVSIK